MKTQVPLYDRLGAGYDRLISWPGRYKREAPFFKKIFRTHGVKTVLDTACGTGMHPRWFADWGLKVTATDLSSEMLKVTQKNTQRRAVRLVQSGFAELPQKIKQQFDVVTCLGNSLPHVLTDGELKSSLQSMYQMLRPGGFLILHNNNYDRIVGRGEHFMALSGGEHVGGETLYLRLFDQPKDKANPPVLNFHVVTLSKLKKEWTYQVDTTQHRALYRNVLEKALLAVGFKELEMVGSFHWDPFLENESDNLIVIAHRPLEHYEPALEPMNLVNQVVIFENDDPMVDLAEVVPNIICKETPCWARKTVSEMLKRAQKKLPSGYRFHIMHAFRSHHEQQKLYRRFERMTRKEHPDWPESQVRRRVNRFVAPPDDPAPPGHSTGAALDLTVMGPDGNDLDMTSPFAWGAESARTDSPRISELARSNRNILFNAMLSAGFSNCAAEWWHYSYGDSAWAVRVGRNTAVYGTAKLPKKR